MNVTKNELSLGLPVKLFSNLINQGLHWKAVDRKSWQRVHGTMPIKGHAIDTMYEN